MRVTTPQGTSESLQTYTLQQGGCVGQWVRAGRWAGEVGQRVSQVVFPCVREYSKAGACIASVAM